MKLVVSGMRLSVACRTIAVVAVITSTACARASAPLAESSTSRDDPFFAVAPTHAALGMEALYTGPLVVERGCIMIGRAGHLSVPVWPKGFTAQLDESGRVVVLDASGGTVAMENQDFDMGGGYIAEFEPRDKVEAKPTQVQRVEDQLGYDIPDACLGDGVYGVWLVGDTQPL